MSSEYTPTRSGGGNRSRRGGQRRSGGSRNGGSRNHPHSNIEAASKPAVAAVPVKKSLFQKVLSLFGLGKPEKKISYARKENNFGGAETKRSGSSRGERTERPERSSRSRGESSEKSEPRAERAPKAERAPRPTGFRTPEIVEVTSSRIYVGNLSFDATESDLQELFSGVGQVQNVEIVANKHTQRSKGFGFVQLQSIEEAKRAVTELHDKEYMGRKLVVSGAKAVEEKRSERQRPEASAPAEPAAEEAPLEQVDAQPAPEARRTE